MKSPSGLFELHRAGIALLPAPGQKADLAPIWVHPPEQSPLRLCGCTTCKAGKTCGGMKQLMEGLRSLPAAFLEQGWEPILSASVFFRVAKLAAGDAPVACSAVKVRPLVGMGDERALQFLAPNGQELARFFADGPSQCTLLERLGKAPSEQGFIDRAGLLQRLAMYQRTQQERLFAERGMPSQKQRWEESFHYRFAYHCHREMVLTPEDFLQPKIDRETGLFHLELVQEGQPQWRLTLPRTRVEAALKLLRTEYPEREDLAIHPLPLRSIFRVAESTELDDVELRPEIALLQATGEVKYLKRPDMARFRYGRLVFVPELNLLAELEDPNKERKFATPRLMKLQRSQVPSFLDDHREDLESGEMVLDDSLRGLRIHRAFDRLVLDTSPAVAEKTPGFFRVLAFAEIAGNRVALTQLLDARRRGLPYCEVGDSWIDTQAIDVARLESLPVEMGAASAAGQGTAGFDPAMQLAPRDVLRLQGAFGKERLQVVGPGAETLRSLLAQEPRQAYQKPEGFRSELRHYQVLGVEWLSSLTDYDLGALLCDDMGLGKTHQAMAWMASLDATEEGNAPFLIVCPTSVLGHWRDKLERFAPNLRASTYHGSGRELRLQASTSRSVGRQVVLTSFGILRNSAKELAAITWRAVLFDEIQYLKNKETHGYAAALRLQARTKIGLTGTPIENDLLDLHALFDLVLPGYLGDESAFRRRFLAPVDPLRGGADSAELRRWISPFVLRRRKSSVLEELPAKIEDSRFCELSDEQAELYQQILEGNEAQRLVGQVADAANPVPYLHVFAVLDRLKRICDHPALALKRLDQAENWRSGKWELFTELLAECLDNGLKVVVFTQYLGMLDLMASHLQRQGIAYGRLEGKTPAAERTAMIDRFNRDATCRVFLASLKAGGTGIDLVGGSVVIHYDRWWNAAREDQATDRVHRLGQHRAVQVFKLVTTGTLEERIAEIIENKRDLLDEVVQEDDGKLAKIFSREELLELLRPLHRR